jgi:EAL domain-containing protein (putative c-di-GMP-specific phosphodiesterase class I)
MSLVRDIDTQLPKQVVVQSMAKLCRELGITVILEGIETSAERDALTGMGCDLFQGELFGPPNRQFMTPMF